MQLIRTEWMENFTFRDDGLRNTYWCSQVPESLSLQWPSFHQSPFVRSFVYNKPPKNLCTTLIIQITRGNKCIISHPQNTTAFQPNHIFDWNTSVTSHKQETVIFHHRKNNCQGQLQPPESVSVNSPEPRPREVASFTVDFSSSEISDTIKPFFSVTLVWDKAEP